MSVEQMSIASLLKRYSTFTATTFTVDFLSKMFLAKKLCSIEL